MVLSERTFQSHSPEETYAIGERLGTELKGGETILLTGRLGAGKTLFTKAILEGIGFDTDDVTSPSFALVNLYKTEKFNVYHIDLWRVEAGANAAFSVGLDEILDDPAAVVIIEWADRLGDFSFTGPVIRINIDGDGDEPRSIFVDPYSLLQ